MPSTPGAQFTSPDASAAKRLTVDSSNPPQIDPKPAPDFRGKKVLVVDDNSDNRRIISRLLRDTGAQWVFAENGQECLAAIEEAKAARSPIDLILLDMQMPVLDGYSAARRLRDKSCRIPIIAVTAHAMPDDRGKCLAAGCDDYLSKPVERGTFFTTLRKHLPASESEAESDPSGSRSNLASDPAFAPILAEYVSRMPLVSRQIRSGLESRDANLIRSAAHKIRGTAANYGFPRITVVAGHCDDAIRASEPWSKISEQAEALDRLIQSAIAERSAVRAAAESGDRPR